MTARKGDARRGTEKDRLMARYAVQPLGGGSYGVYDVTAGTWVETFRGRGAMQKANRKWRSLVGVS